MINGISHTIFSSTMLIKVTVSFFLQWLRVMSKKTYSSDCLCYSHLIGTKITHAQLDVPAWGSLNGCCDFSNVFSSNFCCTYTLCGIFCETHWSFKDYMLPVGTFPWFVCFGLPCLQQSKISFRVINRVFQASFSLPGLKGRSLLHRISERREKLWLLLA